MAFLSIVLVNSAFGDVPIVQLTGIPSKQSIIGDRYTLGPAFGQISAIAFSGGTVETRAAETRHASAGGTELGGRPFPTE